MPSIVDWLWPLAADAPTSPLPSAQDVRPPNMLTTLIIPLVIVFGIMYLFVLGPQRRKEKDRRRMLDNLKKGDDVVTIGGLHGKVWQIKEREVILEVARDVRLTLSRSAILNIVTEEGTADSKDSKSSRDAKE